MDRIKTVRAYTDGILDEIPSDSDRRNAYIHTYGVAEACSLIAGRRGLNTELAYISGLLHDLYVYKTGIRPGHSHSGAEMGRPAIRNMNIFSDDEKIIILSAIHHHADKEHVHDDYDEILKDADLLQQFLNNTSPWVFYSDAPRLKQLLREFHIDTVLEEYGFPPASAPKLNERRLYLADYAERLAARKITGDWADSDFLQIIKYYPEESAFKELKNGWCAAFVYHCSMETGLNLPLRPPLTSCRLAGVGAWYEWGKYNGFLFYEKDGFTPARGDIVIYNNIIPPGNKQKDSPWHDHIGIVLGCEPEYLTVAEGNVDNMNVSGITTRRRDETIGCYVRIPDDYVYDGWKYDYKTGRIRTDEYGTYHNTNSI